MKRFLINIALFLVLSFSGISGMVLISDLAANKKKSEYLRINDNIAYVFSGDSHVECSVNDALVENSINIAQSGEAYLYSYIKIKALLESNDQIKEVFIGFSYGDLLIDKEDRWLFSDVSVIEFVKNYNYLLSRDEKSLILKHNAKAYLKGLIKSVFKNLQILIRSETAAYDNTHLKNFGGYEYLVRDKLQEDIGMADDYRNEPFKESLLQKEYLIKISEFCRLRSVNLILLNTPKYPLYNRVINDEIRSNWIDFKKALPRDSLLDLSTMVLPDSCYGDMTHLNYKGAEFFSRYLNGLIRQAPEDHNND